MTTRRLLLGIQAMTSPDARSGRGDSPTASRPAISGPGGLLEEGVLVQAYPGGGGVVDVGGEQYPATAATDEPMVAGTVVVVARVEGQRAVVIYGSRKVG